MTGRGKRARPASDAPPPSPSVQASPAHQADGRWRATSLVLTVLLVLPIAGFFTWHMSQAGKFEFQRPWALLLLLAMPLAFWVRLLLDRRRRAVFGYSSTAMLRRVRPGIWARIAPLPGVLRVVALGLLAVALAGPQTRDRGGRVEVEGIDIMLALDLSNSMEATDLAPNRLEAAKKVIDEFISRRSGDKIGLVVFGREAYTHCPLTLDYGVLRTMLAELRLGLVNGAGTAIGNALGVALARLRQSEAKSRVIILLTDGDNNSGNVTPKQAARYAAAMKVKTFTILVGPTDGAPSGRDVLGRPLRLRRHYPVNPELLQEIAAATSGKAYRATDRQALRQRFQQILDELDKSTRRDVAAPFVTAYRPLLAAALLLILLEVLLGLTRMRQFS